MQELKKLEEEQKLQKEEEEKQKALEEEEKVKKALEEEEENKKRVLEEEKEQARQEVKRIKLDQAVDNAEDVEATEYVHANFSLLRNSWEGGFFLIFFFNLE